MDKAEIEEILQQHLQNIPADGVYAALSAAQGDFPVIAKAQEAEIKSERGASYKYRYADLGDIMAGIRPVLAKHGLGVTQPIEMLETGKLVLRSTVFHSDGSALHSVMPLPLPGERPQAFGSTLTYYRRYALTALLGIATEEDDDGQAAQHAPQRPQERDQGPYRGANGGEVRVKPAARGGPPSATSSTDEGLLAELEVLLATVPTANDATLAKAKAWMREKPKGRQDNRWTILGAIALDRRNEASALISQRDRELAQAEDLGAELDAEMDRKMAGDEEEARKRRREMVRADSERSGLSPIDQEPHGLDPWGLKGNDVEMVKTTVLAGINNLPWTEVQAAWAIYEPVLKEVLHGVELKPLQQAYLKRQKSLMSPTAAG